MSDPTFSLQEALGGIYHQLQDLNEKVTRSEVHLQSLIGNGQPGRIDKLEEDVKDLDRFKYKVLGAWGVIWAGIEYLVHRH